MKITTFVAIAVGCGLGTSLFAQGRATSPRVIAGDAATSRSVLDDFSEGVQHLVRQVTPAVMQVVTEGFGGTGGGSDSNGNTVTRQTGIASCVAVSADGDLIT
ncbi:MAG TPA: hypothetical protein VGG59_06955, partial [Acidobacteriaceae bacterium]